MHRLKKIFFALISFSIIFILAGFKVEIYALEEDSKDGSAQQILEFELSGFGDKGERTWHVKGKSADIFSDTIKLGDIQARVYGEEDNVNLTADAGNYDKKEGKIHLEDNVVITTDSGAKLVTDTLDWYQEKQKVITEDEVDITKENIKIVGKGIEAEPDLKKVKLKEEIKVDIKDGSFSLGPQDDSATTDKKNQPITITCEGPLNVDYEKQMATFNKEVKVTHSQGEMYADKMIIFFDAKTNTIKRIESYGNVKIVSGRNTTYSQKAIYNAQDKKIVLTGRPRLVIYSGESFMAELE
jgi:LPS export ABC transporter protein LptC/lipopolysaccharide transport protein LptA